MDGTKRVAITGAAGSLGSLLAREMLGENVSLNLLIHAKELPADISASDKVSVFRTDLAKPATLDTALEGVDVVVHFAGVLFKANPEKFLHTTNTLYFRNLLEAAVTMSAG